MNAKIAVPYSDGQISQHFGKATQFKIYSVADDKVASAEVEATNGMGHEDLALWLVMRGVNAVVCGGVGPGMQGALAAAGIAVLAGVEGAADDAVAKLVAGTLEATDGVTCHGHGGGCGSHCGGGCGLHGCGGGCCH